MEYRNAFNGADNLIEGDQGVAFKSTVYHDPDSCSKLQLPANIFI